MTKNANVYNMLCERCAGRPAPSREVYVIEDDAPLRRSILRALRGAEFAARGYERALDFLKEAPGLAEGCLVTDLRMPRVDGLELIRRVRAAGLPFGIILITGHADVQFAVAAMKAGASEFIEKPFATEVLLGAIERTLRGPAVGVRPGDPDARWLSVLTAREREVLEAVVGGATSKVIARRLQISPRTVEAHRGNLMRKSGAAGPPNWCAAPCWRAWALPRP